MNHGEAAIAPVSLAMSPTAQLLFWLAILAVAVVLLAFILLQVRRRMLGDDASGAAQDQLSLEDIRRLKERGEISDREHRALRSAAMARMGIDVGKADGADPEGEAGEDPQDPSDAPADERRAAPGFDLTGEPLPTPPVKPNDAEEDPDEGGGGRSGGSGTGR